MPLNENDFGAYLPTTDIVDPSNIYAMDLKGPELANLLARLYQTINNISSMVNIKDTGYYTLSEFVCGQLYFPDITLTSTTPQLPAYRNVYRKVINFGALPAFPAPGTKSVAHGIDFTSPSLYTFTRIYGSATKSGVLIGDPVRGVSLPYASPTLANNIELYIDATNVVINVGADQSLFTRCVVVIEYIKR